MKEWKYLGTVRRRGGVKKDGTIPYNDYYVSNDGEVKMCKQEAPNDCRTIPTALNGGIKGKFQYLGIPTNLLPEKLVHRAVAKLFVHNPDPETKIQVDHINGDKLDNHYTNLEWVTPSENMYRMHARLKEQGIVWKGGFKNK